MKSFLVWSGLDKMLVHNSSIGDLVTHSLTDSKILLKNTTIEHSERLVTLETCNQSDEFILRNTFKEIHFKKYILKNTF